MIHLSSIPFRSIIGIVVLVLIASCTGPEQPSNRVSTDPLPSWNEGPAKEVIVQFVTDAVNPDSDGFIPEEERIAVFDNDGTLWSEQPLYFQFYFITDRIRELAPEHPEWENQEPFKSLLSDDVHGILASGKEGIMKLTLAATTGMSETDFYQIVNQWMDTARHPVTGLLFKEMVFQPMLEALDYFQRNGFQTYIVSGGGQAFMRPWTNQVYGIPPEQVIGSTVKTSFQINNGSVEIMRMPEMSTINDKEVKPLNINKYIGKKPVAAFGNSDGDLAMLQWTASGEGPRLMVFIHHTDSTREYAYDRNSPIGKLDKGLDAAETGEWLVVDMKEDWNVIFPQPQ